MTAQERIEAGEIVTLAEITDAELREMFGAFVPLVMERTRTPRPVDAERDARTEAVRHVA